MIEAAWHFKKLVTAEQKKKENKT